MEWITTPEIWISLLTLTLLEIVLGIDNIVFISILASKLPKEQQDKARKIGLALALISRIILLLGIAWMSKLTTPLFTVLGKAFAGRDLILLFGGLFLIGKATHEIHDKLEGEDGHKTSGMTATMGSVLLQIMILDVVFSLDSVITAVGMVKEVPVMITAVIIAMIVMLIFVNTVSKFIDKHPTLKVLALSFLILIGFVLTLEGFHVRVEKGYIYFAMAFSLGVEIVNMKLRNRRKKSKVELHQPYR
ncbi:MAG: TerC family protein [Verrucomicrobia bacterium]|jgi:predicted tellurium resistance membrane protein TerC|nr:TerC family protein [Verrucomicrobiota bacterium]